MKFKKNKWLIGVTVFMLTSTLFGPAFSVYAGVDSDAEVAGKALGAVDTELNKAISQINGQLSDEAGGRVHIDIPKALAFNKTAENAGDTGTTYLTVKSVQSSDSNTVKVIRCQDGAIELERGIGNTAAVQLTFDYDYNWVYSMENRLDDSIQPKLFTGNSNNTQAFSITVKPLKHVSIVEDSSQVGNQTTDAADDGDQGDSTKQVHPAESAAAIQPRALARAAKATAADKLSATAIPTTLFLGGDPQIFDWGNQVEDVKLDQTSLTKDQYTVTLQNSISTDFLDTKQATLRIALVDDPNNYVEINTDVTIVWGNAIKIGGLGNAGSPDEGRSTIALTITSGQNPTLKATQGNQNENYQIHPYFPNAKYYSIDWFDLSQKDQLALDVTSVGTQHLEGMGTDSKQAIIKKWTAPQISYGDIVRGWMAEDRQFLYIDSVAQRVSADQYYEITENGFRLLSINQLKPETQTVEIGMTTAQLDEHRSDCLDTGQNKKLEVTKFLSYPDTSTLGKTEAKVEVVETTTHQKKLSYDYVIPMNVVDTTAPTVQTQKVTTDYGKAVAAKDFVSSVSDNNPKASCTYAFEKEPDWKKAGQQTVTVIVKDADQNEAKVTADLTVKAQPVLEAKTREVTVNLGSDPGKIDPNQFVQEATLDGVPLEANQYKVTLAQSVDTDLVEASTVKLVISLADNPENQVTIEAKVAIVWGNAIKFGGQGNYLSPSEGRSTIAFTIVPGQKPILKAVHGNQRDNVRIHDRFPDEKYYSFDWFDLSQKEQLTLNESSTGTQHLEAVGDDRKQDTIQKWGNPQVSYGDIVRGWMIEDKQFLYTDSVAKKVSNDQYYEITKEGFRLLSINQLKPKTQEIDLGISQAQLDEHLKDYLDTNQFPNVSVEKFVEYPDTSQVGTSEGIIEVSEQTENGKQLTYRYKVPFEVTDPAALIDVKLPTTVLFGSLSTDEGAVQSPTYQVENLGDQALKVNLDEVTVSQNLNGLVLADDSLKDQDNTLRLELQVATPEKLVIPLQEGSINKSFGTLSAKSPSAFQLRGHYNGSYQDEKKIELQLHFSLSLAK